MRKKELSSQEYLRCIIITPVRISRPWKFSDRKNITQYSGKTPEEQFQSWWKWVLIFKKKYQEMPKEALDYFKKNPNSTRWYQPMEDAINTRLRCIPSDKIESVKVIAVGTGEDMYEQGMILLKELD